jgi:PAS domain S-box-containing protein
MTEKNKRKTGSAEKPDEAHLKLEAQIRMLGRALSAAKQRSEKYQRFFDSAADICVILDPDGRITAVNKRFEEELEESRQRILGKNVFSDLNLPRDSVAALRAGRKKLSQGRSPLSLEFVDRTRDGRLIPYEVRAVPVYLDGRIKAIHATLRNISDRKQSELALRNSEETLRVLLNAIGNAAFLINATGQVLAVNESGARGLGKTVERVVGRSISDFLPPEAAERRRRVGIEVIRTGKAAHYEDEVDGRFFEITVYPIFDQSGEVTKLAIHAIDVTERKQAEAQRNSLEIQLQRAQRMEAIGTLAGGIAHDFNNLMMAIQGGVSLMLQEIDPSHAHYDLLKAIEKRIQSGADMTSKLLGYARKGKYAVEPLNLNEVVEETASTFGRMRKDITVRKELSEQISGIMADKGQLEQVVLNLFVNAADAMPSGGRLFLATRNTDHHALTGKPYKVEPGKYVLLSVADNGIGMDKAVRQRIFDPFFTTKQMGRGTGLGLASVYGIVKSHGGYIDVESRKGFGSTFYLYFPASEKVPSVKQEKQSPVALLSGTVMVVDDEQDVLAVTTDLLERMGFSVVAASTGRAALDLFSADPEKFDLIMLDMIMPDMGGGTVLDGMMSVNPNARVLLASGYTLDGQASEIMQRGCAGFIQKPFNYTDLYQKLAGILASA